MEENEYGDHTQNIPCMVDWITGSGLNCPDDLLFRAEEDREGCEGHKPWVTLYPRFPSTKIELVGWQRVKDNMGGGTRAFYKTERPLIFNEMPRFFECMFLKWRAATIIEIQEDQVPSGLCRA